MYNMERLLLIFVCAFAFVSCASDAIKQNGEEVLTASVREAFRSPGTLPIADEITDVEYIPLETTESDESLIDGVVDYAITSKYIYVLVGKEARIVLFDRKGKFVRTFLRQGQGPNDFRGMIGFIQADETNDNLYVIGSKIGVYSLEGEFKKDIPLERPIIYARHLQNDCIAAIGMPFIPFKDSFGIRVFHENGEPLATKKDFCSPLVPEKDSGFTFGIAGVPSDNYRSVLFKMAANDTIFRLTTEGIQPALICLLENSQEKIVRGLNIRRIEKFASPNDIFVSDVFETEKNYYLRLIKDGKFYVASVNKVNGKTNVEPCLTPKDDIYNLADVNIQMGMTGTRGWHGFPLWGRMTNNSTLVQVITPYELELYQSLGEINIPEELTEKVKDDNPVFIFYTIKSGN